MSELLEYKCPSCGGPLKFDSSAQKMKCPYCSSEIDTESLAAYDEELKNDKGDNLDWEKYEGSEWSGDESDNMNVYVCNSCGGEIIADKNTSASNCPYCDNPVVMKGNLSGVFKPDFVIPFKLDKKAAKEAYRKHLQGKKFLPKVFENKNHIDEIKALYVPFWLFDADVDAKIRYRATKSTTHEDKGNEYLTTEYYSVIREGGLSFDNVPVDGSVTMDDELMQSIEPYDFREAVGFQTAYLSGYLADKYSVDSDKAIEGANDRIRYSTAESFEETVKDYDEIEVENSSILLNNGKAKYVLYPVWILNTTYENEKYIFAMNGQTGKMVGDLPLDKSVFWVNFAKVGGIAAAVAFALQFAIAMM